VALPDVFIPWQEMRAVGPLEAENLGYAPTVYPKTMAVTVTREFYEQQIAPKRSILSPPGAEAMFRPKGALMQMVLASPELIVDFEEFRDPIEARWKAFQDEPSAAQTPRTTAAESRVHGRWSYDGSWWQTMMFLAPLFGMAVVVLHASGFWPG
jgi:hypothetical protein